MSGSPGQRKTFLLREATESMRVNSSTIVVANFGAAGTGAQHPLGALADALVNVNQVLSDAQSEFQHFATGVGRVMLKEAA